MPSPAPPSKVLNAFGASGEPALLAGGEGRTYQLGQIVLKRIDMGRESETGWLSDLLTSPPPASESRSHCRPPLERG